MSTMALTTDDSLPTDSREFAEACKNKGNELLKKFDFQGAIDQYTKALESHKSHIYFANRAAAHIHAENYGVALTDAAEAIALDPSYVKAYYRQGSAHLALGEYKKAVKSFKQVCRMKPNDKGARTKLQIADKMHKESAFADAIQLEQSSPLSDTIEVDSIIVNPSYSGPRFPDDPLSEEGRQFAIDVMEGCKRGEVPHRKYVIMLLLAMKEHFSKQKSLLYLELPDESAMKDSSKPHFTVCGDTHGQFFDVCNIFEKNGLPSETNPYLFNGDFVDRGSFSVEVILTFFAWKLVCPKGFFMLRGNHESKNMNKIYGFEGEVHHKYDTTVMKLFTEVFNWLPLAAVLEKKVIVLHGGLFQDDDVQLKDIENIQRNCEPPQSGLMSDLMWSDPQPFPGRGPSKRGIGLSFGPDITKAFLEKNNLELLVRSHEVKNEGYLVEHDGKCITVFSAPNYCDQMGNKGAYIHFEKDMKPQFNQFTAVDHPPIRPMAYAGSLGGMMGF